MTKPTTHTFGEFIIKLGDGATPEVFSAPCGLISKGFNQTANTQDTIVPDCDLPDAPAFVETAVDSLASDISGNGVMNDESFDTWNDWFLSGLSKNCRVYPKGASGGYWAGAYVLAGFNLKGDRGKKTEVDVSMKSDGEWTWNP